jgi:hypothetical protein
MFRQLATILVVTSMYPGAAPAQDELARAKELISARKYAEAIRLLEARDPEESAPRVSYQLARAMALYRRTHPCEAMFESVLSHLQRALERSKPLRRRARRDPALAELRGTCVYQRLARGLDPGKAADLRKLLMRVDWQGTNWGTNQPGPQDQIGFDARGVTLQATRICGGGAVRGRYRVKDPRSKNNKNNKRTISIEGRCAVRPGAAREIEIELTLDLESCSLNYEGEHLFDDVPDECNS